jgi:hypothetical protein
MNAEDDIGARQMTRVSMIALPLTGMTSEILNDAVFCAVELQDMPISRCVVPATCSGLPKGMTTEQFQEYCRQVTVASELWANRLKRLFLGLESDKLILATALQSEFEEEVRRVCRDDAESSDHVLIAVPVDTLQRYYDGVVIGTTVTATFYADEVGYTGFDNLDVFTWTS